MNKLNLASKIGMLFVAGFLTACSTISAPVITEVPVPTNFSAESMMKLQSVSHWNNVAIDMAENVAKKYGTGGGCIPGHGCSAAIFVNTPIPATNFSRAFHTQLVSALVNQGLPVLSELNSTATKAEIDIQLVSFNRGKSNETYDRKPLELVHGVWVIRDVINTGVKKFNVSKTEQWSQGETNTSQWFNSPYATPSYEMLVTVSFVKDNQYMARTSNIYYLDSDDGYVPAVLPKAPAPAPAPAPTPALTKMNVEGDCTAARCTSK